MTTTDLQDAQAPEDVARILRAAAERYNEDPDNLSAAWGDPQAGKVGDTSPVVWTA